MGGDTPTFPGKSLHWAKKVVVKQFPIIHPPTKISKRFCANPATSPNPAPVPPSTPRLRQWNGECVYLQFRIRTCRGWTRNAVPAYRRVRLVLRRCSDGAATPTSICWETEIRCRSGVWRFATITIWRYLPIRVLRGARIREWTDTWRLVWNLTDLRTRRQSDR